MNSRAFLLASTVVFVSACTSPQFRGSASVFGTSLQEASETQKTRMDAAYAAQEAVIANKLAQDRVMLIASPACALLIVQDIDGTSAKSSLDDCIVEREDGKPLAKVETYPNVVALNAAMANYGKSLAALAADASNDNAAFSASLTGLAAAVQELGTTVGVQDIGGDVSLTDLTTNIATASGLVLATARVIKLRRVIVQSDDVVQSAITQLQRYSQILTSDEFLAAIQKADRTKASLRAAIKQQAGTQKIADLQAELAADVKKIKGIAATQGAYQQIGKSHAKLADAARSLGSSKELQTSIIELLDAVETLRALEF